MKSFLKSNVFAWAVVFLPVLVFVRYMEAVQRFDSLGWWYTISVAVGLSLPIALTYVGLRFLIATIRRGGA